MEKTWYALKQIDQTDTPALIVFPARIEENINTMVSMVGNPARLIPHVKTYKMSEVVKLQIHKGIHRFKCATIAEAEMTARAGATEVLMAYQLCGPKLKRFVQLVNAFPKVHFASLVDNNKSVSDINQTFRESGLQATVYIDIDDGMHRTGIPVEGDVFSLYRNIHSCSHVNCRGFHIYDGHRRNRNFGERETLCLEEFNPVRKWKQIITESGFPVPEIIAGGSPTFPIHAKNPEVICSPGTTLFWDQGYASLLPEQHFVPAAVLITRVISKPGDRRITCDLGHKSVAAENPIDKRIFFLNLDNYTVISQSEEHLVIEVSQTDRDQIQIGDVLYGIPYHICPTVALYDMAYVADDGNIIDQWEIVARRRKITL